MQRHLLTLLLAGVSFSAMAQTLTLQPDAASGEDALLASCISCGYSNTNYGTHPDIDAAAWTNGGDESNARSLLRFDLSSIPTGATVTNATLSLYFNPTSSNGDHQGDNVALLQRVTSAWNEDLVTWDSQPGTTTVDQVVMPATISSTEDRPDIDVTALAQAMVADPAQNYGLLFRMQDETAYRRMNFASSDHPDPALHPRLVVTYTDPLVMCLTFPFGAPPEGEDALLASCISCGYSNTNYGTHPDIDAAAWTNGGDESNARSLLRFDLSSIPTGATVTNATLSLYFNPTSSNGDHQGDNVALLQRVTSAWNEDLVTWDSQPGTTTVDQVVMPATTSNTEDRPDIDVTALAQAMVADPAQNYGLLFRMQDETIYRRMNFASSDHPDAALHPRLEVCFIDASGIAAADRTIRTLSLFPLPFSTSCTVDLTSFGAAQVHLTLRDMEGRVVRTLLEPGARLVTLERGGLAPGLYTLSASTDHMTAITARLVVE
jgi:hypothetical protein